MFLSRIFQRDKPKPGKPEASAEPDAGEVAALLGDLNNGRHSQAETSARAMTAGFPGYAKGWKALGVALVCQGRAAEALAPMQACVKLSPDDAEGLTNLGNIFQQLGKPADSEASYRRALAIEPGFADAHCNLGNILWDQGRVGEAEASYRRALEINPASAEFNANLGNALRMQRRFDEAEASYAKALAAAPDSPDMLSDMGLVLGDQGRLDEAEKFLRDALRHDPQSALAHGNLLFLLNYHPDRSAEDIFADYRNYDERIGMPARAAWRAHTNDRNPRRRLRIGYVCPEFLRHSTSFFLEPVMANHDKNEVEVFAYSGSKYADEVTARYRQYADHWINTSGMSDAAAAERVRADGIDILVDVAGHNAGNLLGMFALKPAPVSWSWMAYGYTTGLSAIDYYLTDAICAPPGCEHLFAEQLWRLAGPSFVYRPAAEMGDVGDSPALRNGFITFGTLTRAMRINHRTVHAWAEVLKAVPGSRLVADSSSYEFSAQRERLVSQFAELGIPRERLQMGYNTPPWDVLRSIDIGLDCFPHNSGTTLFESLYMGVPFATLAGRASVGRLGSSILHALGRPEWVAASEAEYVAKLISLAADPAALAAIRSGLRGEMERSPLRDEAGFTRKIESACREMFTIWCEN
jgi:predicted O-linked N-acetylglucosamine transferase (SPINDLY family)